MVTLFERRLSTRRLTPQAAGILAVALLLAVLLGDVLAPADLMVPIVYGLPLVVCAWVRSPPFLWAMAGLLTALTLVMHYAGPPATEATGPAVALLNRVLAAVETLGVALAVHFWILSDNAVEEQRLALERQNQALEAANQELTDREEEIVRQNEELQSQTEELERQSEELRVTNEELAAREKTLEQLLELSRSLTAELTRDEMLTRICEALGVLTNGLASAILEKLDQELAIPCHHGFGPAGLQSETLPFAQSFTALIMSLGQTGYLEDLSLRPDLCIPQPREGEPFRSVLSSPLRVRGHCVGTVEVYAPQRQSWGEAQIAMIESLAAQASISLQSTELIETIRQERRRFEAAFRTVPFGLAVADDAAASQVRLNPAAAAMFNVPLGENVAPSTPFGARLKRHLFRHERPLPEEQLPLLRALGGEETYGDEFDAVFPSGRRLTLLSSAAPIYDGRGKIVGAAWAFADITTQKQLQRELEVRRREAEEASVRKTRFLAAVSHDIRTPVNAINLMADVIRRLAANPALAGQIPEMAQKLQANALSLVGLVSDVLDITRFDTGKIELQESDFLLNDLVGEECRQLVPLAQDKGIELVVKPPERTVWLHTDRVKLGRILGNLIGNAVKFTEHGRVEVSAALGPDRRVLFRVADTGVGIPPEHLAHVFDEFAQLRNPERDRNKGTGLGLAICKRLVEVMGGTLALDSTVGKGSTFTVTLPASTVVLRLDTAQGADMQEPRTGAGSSDGNLLVGMRILLVEDHPTTRESTAQILRTEGAEVREAPDGQAALALLPQGPVDVILLDMMLPDMDGREVLKVIQLQRPAGLKGVLVLTGDLTRERLEEVQQLGADALIGKPIEVHKLVATLRTLQRTGESV
jgi:signal transduction histidine kinase